MTATLYTSGRLPTHLTPPPSNQVIKHTAETRTVDMNYDHNNPYKSKRIAPYSPGHYFTPGQTIEEDEDECFSQSSPSPTTWVCDIGKSNHKNPNRTAHNDRRHLEPLTDDEPTAASWRQEAAESLVDDSSDDENIDVPYDHHYQMRQEEEQTERSSASIDPSARGRESRIVAPNVSKLSPGSAVEVRLQSADTCVAVLCAVDVLKMR
jgi:hypothetical protein